MESGEFRGRTRDGYWSDFSDDSGIGPGRHGRRERSHVGTLCGVRTTASFPRGNALRSSLEGPGPERPGSRSRWSHGSVLFAVVLVRLLHRSALQVGVSHSCVEDLSMTCSLPVQGLVQRQGQAPDPGVPSRSSAGARSVRVRSQRQPARIGEPQDSRGSAVAPASPQS